ncbi:MAG: lamin tail domain-containing protein [Candidatus Krumholzibacteriota bacterium]|nr:lamin tail domain-containing protein [Candidatus Krumholzibacteriota bacterium]
MRRHAFFVAVAVLAACAAMPTAATSQIVINEILADPARDWDGDGEYDYRNDEWVEILNAGSEPVDLAGYLIADGAEGPAWRFGLAGVLEPGGVVVVYGSDSRAWEESTGNAIYGLSLNNTGDVVRLFRVAGGDTVLVDGREYVARAAENDRSFGRRADDPGTWVVFDALNPCPAESEPPGTGCLPTPGAPNHCLTATDGASWSLIKHRTR